MKNEKFFRNVYDNPQTYANATPYKGLSDKQCAPKEKHWD